MRKTKPFGTTVAVAADAGRCYVLGSFEKEVQMVGSFPGQFRKEATSPLEPVANAAFVFALGKSGAAVDSNRIVPVSKLEAAESQVYPTSIAVGRGRVAVGADFLGALQWGSTVFDAHPPPPPSAQFYPIHGFLGVLG